MTRYRAAIIHLGISVVLFLPFLYLLVFVWYPGIFFPTDGGWQGLRIVAAVHLVLGPVLTLVVYKHGKAGLRLDLTLIGMVQFVCLIAGLWLVYQERPIVVVFADGEFINMSADAYRDVGVEPPDLRHFPGPSPKWVMVLVPDDLEEQSRIRRAALKTGLQTATDQYVPFDPAHPDVVRQAEPLELVASKGTRSDALSQFLAKRNQPLEHFRFYPYATRFQYTFLVFTRNSQQFVSVIDTSAE